MSYFARVTRPVAMLDGPVNSVNDLAVRMTPWMWWPASPPRRDRPFDRAQHATYLAWSVAGYLAGDAIATRLPEDMRSTGPQLRTERVVTGVASVVVWLVFVGAWDRRAARLRRRLWR